MPENLNSQNDSYEPLSAWPSTSRQKKTSEKRARRSSPRRNTTGMNASGQSSGKGFRGKSRNRRQELLRRLEVDEEELENSPQISPLLRQNGIRPERLVEILRCDGTPESRAFVAEWDELTPASRSLAGIEAIAIASGITPRRLYEVFAGAAMMQSRESVALTIALNLPNVMRVTVKEALKAKGHFAREHMFKSARVLPVPKGSTTVIQVGKQIAEESEDSDDMDDGGVLEPSDDFMMKASRAMGIKQLPAAVVEHPEED